MCNNISLAVEQKYFFKENKINLIISVCPLETQIIIKSQL